MTKYYLVCSIILVGAISWSCSSENCSESDGVNSDTETSAETDIGTDTDTSFENDDDNLITRCEELKADFVANGGDLIGTWRPVATCVDLDVYVHPYEEECSELIIYSVAASSYGTISFDENTVQTNERIFVYQNEFSLPKDCLVDTLGDAVDCENLAELIEVDIAKATYCEQLDDICFCRSFELSYEPSNDPITYSSNSGLLIIEGEETPYSINDTEMIQQIDYQAYTFEIWHKLNN